MHVWKLSFTSAATVINIWGGISKILPIFFLFLADSLLGNILTLALSGLLSTTGLVLITVSTMPGYRCLDNEEDGSSCVGHKEKVLFITGMGLVALGRAACSASSQPLVDDESDNDNDSTTSHAFGVILFITSAVGFFVFPYIKRWYILFGVSAIFTAVATLFFLVCLPTFKSRWGPRKDGSPLTDVARVFVAAAFNISRSLPENGDSYHRLPSEEFEELTSTRIFGFLHKAAILPTGGEGVAPTERSWRLSSVSKVESAKVLMRTVTVSSSYLLCGVVSSTADTYFIEQATNLSTNIWTWKAPLQLFLVLLMFYKFCMKKVLEAEMAKDEEIDLGVVGTMSAVVYCAVAAAVERRRLHAVRRRGLIHRENVPTPMSVAWLIFQAFFLWMAEDLGTTGLTKFHKEEGPASMERYAECMSEAVSGVGFMCGALLVYVVGVISETGGGKGWFQETLNMSRLDRYYWVLAALGAVYLVVSILGLGYYTPKKKLTRLQEKKDLTPLGAQEPVSET